MPLQGISSGVFKFSTTTQNRARTSIPGTMAISVDDNNTITGDFRVHDGLTPGGISNPPPGTVSHIITKYDSNFTDNISEPDGWFFCDGREVVIAEYNALYQAIGTHWNVGTVTNGSYKIPDLRNHYVRCTTGAVGISQKQDSVIQKHSHWMLWDGSGTHTHTYTPYQNGNYPPNVYALYVTHTDNVSGSDDSRYDNTGIKNQPVYGAPGAYTYNWGTNHGGPGPTYITMGYGSSLPANGGSALEHHHQVSLNNSGSSEVDLYHVKLATFIKY